ncbi:hypothetical protein Q8791_19600 [Nocardiopsis sp. CT-R113]|uniref:DivIVA domain-containing protein n=1 Tax=Nocardiopsis codii TaxID=3065942 RepID=A0ABU7KB15_9ACTN|nr:hypothetical protein [Nocardiopsis sp. CT-R113]MEE2039428.1 hypothetical protein [Nocardiopsis sp. CT-R113]
MTSPEPPPPLPAFPVFDVVLRGFNRAQVDDLLHRTASTLAVLTGSPLHSDAPFPFPRATEEEPPAPISAAELGQARLDLALRGYDRTQVQDVLHHLVDLLSDAESRASRG